ncbi:MAG: hypothetical protein ACE5Q6_24270 [Dehalococcoidia bacterium]
MPNGQAEIRAPDPETLGIIFVFGGIFAVGTFILYDWASRVGPQLETPGPIRALNQALYELTRPFQPDAQNGLVSQWNELQRV